MYLVWLERNAETFICRGFQLWRCCLEIGPRRRRLLRKWDRLASASPFCAIIWDHYFICENGSPLKLHSEAVQRFTTSHQRPLSWLHLWASCFTATWCFEWGCIMLLEGEGHASVKELQISGARFKLLSDDEWWSALPAPPHIAG